MQEAADKFEEKRTLNALPGKQQHEKLDVTAFKKSQHYTDVYQEGTLQNPDTFLAQNDVDPDIFPSKERKMAFIEEEVEFLGSETAGL